MKTHESSGFAVRQEADVVASRAIVVAGATVLVVGGLGVAAAWFLVRATTGGQTAVAVMVGPRSLSNVEQTPILDARDGLDLRARQEAELRTWGWADRDAGVATIPIERAIDLMIRRESR